MLYSVSGFLVIAMVSAMFGFTALAAGAAGLVFLLLLVAAVLAGVLGALDRGDQSLARLKDSRGV